MSGAEAYPAATPAPTPAQSSYAPVSGADSYSSTNPTPASGYGTTSGSAQGFGTAAPSSQSGFAPVAGAPAAGSYQVTPPPVYTQAPPAGAPQAGYAPVAGAPAAGSYATPATPYTGATPYAPKKSNTLLKVVVAAVLVLFVGGALALAGLWYAAQKIKAKTAQALQKSSSPMAGVLGGVLSDSSSSDDSGKSLGDPCRFLSAAEVSHAVGVPIIRTEAGSDGCSYIAKGTAEDMTAKHMSSMLGQFGADAKTQKLAQQFAGGVFSQNKEAAAEQTGETPIVVVNYQTQNAAVQMRLNRGALGNLGGPQAPQKGGSGDLTGIGDEAYVAADGMLMFRKGGTLATFRYTTCPCSTPSIIPLARTLAARL